MIFIFILPPFLINLWETIVAMIKFGLVVSVDGVLFLQSLLRQLAARLLQLPLQPINRLTGASPQAEITFFGQNMGRSDFGCFWL